MSSFAYTAVNQKGKRISGNVEAAERAAVIKSLTAQDLRPLSIKELTASSSMSVGKFFGAGKVKNDHIVIFTRELSAMIGAGVPLLRALTSLQGHSESPALK